MPLSSKLVSSRLPCPVCPSSDAYHEYDDGHGYCFSCQHFKPGKEAFDTLNYTYEYIPWRGLNKDTLKFYNILTKVDPEGKPISVGFRYADGATKVRTLAEKEFVWSKEGKLGADTSRTGLFGRDKFSAGSHKYITITEGEIDAASLYQCLRSPVVSVQSASSAVRDCAVDRAYLNSFERIYLCLDNDVAGRDACRGVASLFDFNKVYLVRLTKHKDANAYLEAGEGDDLRNIWWNAKKYLPETIISSFDEFEKVLNEQAKPSVPYPFKTLNDMTFGIRTAESVLVTAQEGVGKTEIMHAVLYGLLKGTDDNVGAIFLEEPKRRLLQALAGLELGRPAHLPNTDVTGDQVIAALQNTVVRDDRLHVYSHFGSDDPEVLLDTIRFLVSARNVRYVLFDHISMAVSGLAGDDERRALDYLSTRLEMMVKELDFSLIFVSHVNDYGQTRGSRYISKIADIRIDLMRDLTNPDPAERNITHLTIAKNRFSGMTGPAGRLRFNPGTYTLEEVFDGIPANDNDPTLLRKTAA